ncbi:MAG: magnesium transporter [candidate division WOR-3 bacterium]
MNIVNLLLPEIKEHIRTKEFEAIKLLLNELHPAEIADIIENLETSEAIILLRLLNTEKAAEVLSLFEGPNLEKILKGFTDEQLAKIVEEMDPDDRTALFEELPPQMVRTIISLLPGEERDIALRVLNYPENSAGRYMSTDFVSCYDDDTVGDVINKLRGLDISDELMLNIYVLGKNDVLKGYVKLTKLIKHDSNERIINLVESTPTVSAYDDIKLATKIISDYDLFALPVVDKGNRLLGIITVDDILDVVEESASEEIYRVVGMIDPEARYFTQSLKERFLKRFLPLVVMIILGNVSGWVLHSFESVIAHIPILVFFLPNLANTTGIIGSQSSVFTIRAIATGEIERSFRGFLNVFFKEFATVIFLAFAVGFGMFLISLIRGNFWLKLAFVVGTASAVSCITAATVGIILPLILRSLRIDPAGADVPFITTFGDAITYSTYFILAKVIIG